MDKQDILNAFREWWRGHSKYYFEMGTNEKTHESENARKELEQWLLTTLTEFENWVRKQAIKEVRTNLNDIPFESGKIKFKDVAEFLDRLEKEKHT